MRDNRRIQERKSAIQLDEAPTIFEVSVGAEESFHKMLGEAIDKAFSSLGESARDAIYFHLEGSFGIGYREITNRIDDFLNALEKIFGLGSRQLEIMFMENLQAKVRNDYKWDSPEPISSEFTFGEYIRMVRQNSEQKDNWGASKRNKRAPSVKTEW